ncbi:hypothetical protein [Microbacterium xylanilyticum]
MSELTVAGHEITRSVSWPTQWPHGVAAYWSTQRRDPQHHARCTCGWTAESSAPVVVQHLSEAHLVEATPAEASDPEPTGSH